MTTVYKFKAYFTKAGVGAAPANAPTVDVVNTDTDTKLATGQAAVSKTSLAGYYEYEYSGADGLDLVGHFNTADSTMDQQDLCSYTSDTITTNVNATIASRSSHSAADVWTSATRTLTSFGTLVADIWTYVNRSLTTFGTLIADIIAAVSGGGSTTFTYTVTNSLTGLPIDGVSVKCTTDIAGANIVTTVTTDTFGNAVFYLDPGTYYFWCTKSGYSFTNPDTEIIA